MGYAGNKDVKTPNFDKLAAESVNFSNAVSVCPVCSPYRASLITGRYPLTHGVFLNDLLLNDEVIPRELRQGFDFWKVLGCTHNYNNSYYFADENIKLKWEGYDSIAQTQEAKRYIREHSKGKPFALVLSWGPPHAPYHTAPQKYRDMFDPGELSVRDNVPKELHAKAQNTLAGYYAHIAALDDCIAELMATLKETGIEKDTIFVFTSDHGDMLHSRGQMKKQRPWDESVRVPFLLHYPAAAGEKGRTIEMPINTPDIMPTILALSGIEIPDTVEGTDFSDVVRGKRKPKDNAALITCPSPFGQWTRKHGGKEYRGVRTKRYTYVRDLKGPWLLYDNEKDPFQQDNLCNKPKHAKLQKKLEGLLSQKLKETNDEFLPGPDYIKKWGYKVHPSGTVGYTQ